jgi:hypothetical protein
MSMRQNAQLVIDETEDLLDGSLFPMPPARERAIDLLVVWHVYPGRAWRILTIRCTADAA